jgi:hypothetical protein
MPKSVASWEPYCHRSDAEFHLSKFAARVLGPRTGVIFFDGIAASRLKCSVPDQDGDALTLVVSSTRLPVAPLDPLSTASPQTIHQLSQAWVERLATASSGKPQNGPPTALDRAVGNARDFIGKHKIAFDTAAVVGDTFGVLAGVVSIGALIVAGVTLAPVLGLVAGAASLLLLAEDGRMLRYELRGDEVRKQQLENSWHYKLVETVGPIMVLPDLAVSGARTFASLPKTAREVGEAAEEATQSARRLADQRQAIDRLTRANRDHPDQPWMGQQASQMREQANGLADTVRTAQQKLDAARRELMLLRTIEAPAYLATIYGTGVYGVDPPDLFKRSMEWMSEPSAQYADPIAQLLMPQRLTDNPVGNPSTVLQFQVGVSHHPEHAP